MARGYPDQIHLEQMSFEEVAAAIAEGCTTVVIPLGAVEQHGPHLSLGMDADHADALAERIARDRGHTLVAPTIKVGCSSHHLPFPGTISLRPETLEAICLDYCTSLAGHGFKRLLIHSGHIGNFPVIKDMLGRLRDAVPPDVEILAFSDSTTWIDTWRDAVREAKGDVSAVGGHADIAETSLMMVIRPESVRQDRFEVGHLGGLSESDLELVWKNGIRSVSPNGVIGSPFGSNREIGEACLAAVAELLIETFESATKAAGARR
ncbi:creatininase family protein [Rhodopseudomonas palustris]|uniref:Creatininase family protein n=1 Tax=Rhodopseudomonas palustris TaxID=1076 RepID=A0A323UCJ7_RHOPL|nr:creatininase family protein [Rhodopseudomonas palustris]PZA10454.1 creatininase family protein [Rhodopseudomonas palustris]